MESKNKQTKNWNSKIKRTVWWLPEMAVGEMGKGGQQAQTPSYIISKSWGCQVQHGDYI